jgi:hypothetical protein
MKKLLTITAAILAASPVNAETLYVYRLPRFTGAGTPWSVMVDGKQAVILTNGTYAAIRIRAGRHTLSNLIDAHEIDITPGQDRYVRLRPFFSAKGYKFEDMQTRAGKADVAGLKQTTTIQ